MPQDFSKPLALFELWFLISYVQATVIPHPTISPQSAFARLFLAKI